MKNGHQTRKASLPRSGRFRRRGFAHHELLVLIAIIALYMNCFFILKAISGYLSRKTGTMHFLSSQGWTYTLFICVLVLPVLIWLVSKGLSFCRTQKDPVEDWGFKLFLWHIHSILVLTALAILAAAICWCCGLKQSP